MSKPSNTKARSFDLSAVFGDQSEDRQQEKNNTNPNQENDSASEVSDEESCWTDVDSEDELMFPMDDVGDEEPNPTTTNTSENQLSKIINKSLSPTKSQRH